MSTQKQWFIKQRGGKRGPFSSAELRRLAEIGEVTHETLVSVGPSENWTAATRVKGLFPVAGEPIEPQSSQTEGETSMAKFLDTTGVSYHLQQIINQARETLILISPYLKLSQRLRQSLEDKDRMKMDIRVVYGKSELQPGELAWLRGLQSVRTSFCENLHAKCYLNESEALVTSMNLYEFSQVNNHEMGIYVAKETDRQLYNAILEEARRLIRIGEEVRLWAEVVEVETVEPLTKAASSDEVGFCIRCRNEIVRNLEAPYCSACYRVWKKYDNPKYLEKYCVVCGKENASTLNKPTCYACYKQGKTKKAPMV